jgi:competence protein ComEC
VQVPAAVAAVPFFVGSAAALILSPGLQPDIALIGTGAAALALLAAAASAATDDGPGACVSIVVGCALGGLGLGSMEAERVYTPSLLAWHQARQPSDAVVLEGALLEDAVPTAYGISLTIAVDRADGEPTSGGVRLSVAGSLGSMSSGEWRRGRRVRLPALLRRPTVYHDPGVPDEGRALARRGICLVGGVKSAALVERLENASGVDEAASGARAWARRRLAATIAPRSERSAAITTAILIGDRGRLRDDDERRLREAGTYHVIAISGGNIAIVTALLMLIGRVCRAPQPATATLTIVALLFYGQITGPAPSVGRAITAAVIFLAARVVDHRGPPLNALAVAALFAVAASPAAVLDPGFLLSFGATLGILLGTPIALAAPSRARRGVVHAGRRWVVQAATAVLVATVCAELALAPINASLFGRITFAGLLLNFVAIPLMTVVQLAGAAVLAVPAAWSPVTSCFVGLADAAAWGLVESARLIDIAPWLAMGASPPSWPLIAAYYAAVAALLSSRLRRRAVAAVAGLTAVMVAGPPEFARDAVPPPRYPLRVIVLDVGQGDATLISVGARHWVLVDAGGVATYSAPTEDEASPGFDVGERVVVPALRALGVPRLDAILLTHGDPDHILGAPAVLRALKVASVWEGVPVPPHAGLQLLRTLAVDGGATWRTVQARDRERLDEVELRVLHPPPPEWERQRIRNEDSIVVEVRLGSVSIVLTGDVGREGERAMLPFLEPGRLTVLKAGHHGSATSSTPELLAALRPSAVVFSAGRDNRFGHPHPMVLARFVAIGSAIFRTDRDGAVFIETDGATVQIRGWTGRTLVMTSHAAARTTTRRHDDTRE